MRTLHQRQLERKEDGRFSVARDENVETLFRTRARFRRAADAPSRCSRFTAR
jgi:hypothetical protein